MITAIDFGCCAIRSAWRSSDNHRQVTLVSECSEYTVLPGEDTYREALTSRGISHAECEDSVVVFGNSAAQVRWLSRKPCAPLFTDGQVPTQDAPARQILNILTQSMLPQPIVGNESCCFTSPGGREKSHNTEFLSRLIRMHGFKPVTCSATQATNLACGSEHNFTVVTICMGTAISEVSISRLGVELAYESIDVGSAWIDSELARQHEIQVWDETGQCYLDHEAVRKWKHDPQLHLRNTTDAMSVTLSRLYGVVLDRIARSAARLMNSAKVTTSMQRQRFAVICSGGPTQIGGFAGALTERFVEQNAASRILSVRVVDDPSAAVVRGLLIHGELEARRNAAAEDAA